MSNSDQLRVFHIDLNYRNLREDYLRRWLARIAEVGYNAILWEIEDKVRLDSCPDRIWPEALSKEAFKDVLNYSRDLGLEPIPLLQTIGHGEYILMGEAYARLRESRGENHHDCYCTENPETRRFLKGLIDEYLDLFGDIRHFHLGGDEAYVFATCPICSAKAERIGRNALYMEHVADLSEGIRSAGARPGIWCDMILSHPEEMEAIPTDYVIWDWNYHDTDATPDGARIWGGGFHKLEDIPEETLKVFPEMLDGDGKVAPFYTSRFMKRMGYDVILCGASRSGGDSVFFPKTETHAGNVFGAAKTAAELDLLGYCVTSWAIRLNSFETQAHLFPLARKAVDDPAITLREAEIATSKDVFGVESGEFFDIVRAADQHRPPFTHPPTLAVQWNRLKDSMSAPSNHLKARLNAWKTENDGELFNTELEKLNSAKGGTLNALAALQSFVLKATRGFDILDAWLEALTFQLWMVRLGEMIFEDRIDAETVKLLRDLKNRYAAALEREETPESAAKNAGLVFDWLIEYCDD